MSNSQGFKRYPAIRCWISHILEGTYIPEEKILDTVFGKIKRVRILATLLNKQEHIFSDSFDENQKSIGLKFTIDDGTGIIDAFVKNIDINRFSNVSKGDIIDVIGIITPSENSYSISPTEIIKKVEMPDYRLLRDAEVIEKIKLGKFPQIFDKKKPNSKIDLKEQVYEMIEKYSEDANDGISFNELGIKLGIKDNELRNIIRDLEVESRIYPSEEDIYQCF
jgi:hypothetical protein